MADSNQPDSLPHHEHPVSQGDADQNRQRGKRSGSRRGGRPQESTDQQRQSRSRIDRAMVGYSDGVERAICQGVSHVPPRSSPVQHRTGLATVQLVVVDQSTTSILLCDGQHDGPHIWPNGDVVGGSRFEMPVVVIEPAIPPE